MNRNKHFSSLFNSFMFILLEEVRHREPGPTRTLKVLTEPPGSDLSSLQANIFPERRTTSAACPNIWTSAPRVGPGPSVLFGSDHKNSCVRNDGPSVQTQTARRERRWEETINRREETQTGCGAPRQMVLKTRAWSFGERETWTDD